MKSIVQAELHDAKIKLVHAIDKHDHELINKLEKIIKELEQSLNLLDK